MSFSAADAALLADLEASIVLPDDPAQATIQKDGYRSIEQRLRARKEGGDAIFLHLVTAAVQFRALKMQALYEQLLKLAKVGLDSSKLDAAVAQMEKMQGMKDVKSKGYHDAVTAPKVAFGTAAQKGKKP